MPRKLVPQRFVQASAAAMPVSEGIAAAWRTVLSDDARCGVLERPAQLLSEYFRERGRSRLGRIVDTANRMATAFDTVVLVGPSGSTAAAAALFGASSHPYYHRLSHGGRGGRPRIVLVEPTWDNDLLQGALDLAKSADDGHAPGDRWALVVAEPSPAASSETRNDFAPVLDVFDMALGDSAPSAEAAAARRFVLTDEGEIAPGRLPALAGASFFDGPALFLAALVGSDTVALCKGAAWFHEDAKQAAPHECEGVRLAAVVAASPTQLFAWHHALEPLARRFVDVVRAPGLAVVSAYDPAAQRAASSTIGEARRVHLFSDFVRRDRVSIPSPLVAAYDEFRAAERRAAGDDSTLEIRLSKLNDQSLGELCAWFEAVKVILHAQS